MNSIIDRSVALYQICLICKKVGLQNETILAILRLSDNELGKYRDRADRETALNNLLALVEKDVNN